MNKTIFILLATLAISTSKADYTVKIPLETTNGGHLPTGSISFPSQSQLPEIPETPSENWIVFESLYSDWVNNGSATNCSNWSPEINSVTIGQSFTQTATDCLQEQIRSRQDREQETTTGAIRNVGSAVNESQNITTFSTRTATGLKETWVGITSVSTDWINNGAVTGCSNWSPEPSTVAAGTAFSQTATDCSQSQTRSTQNREQETTTGSIRNTGTPITETQSIVASSTRSATGTKVVQACNGNYIIRVSQRDERPYYGDAVLVAYWSGVEIYKGNPDNFYYGGTFAVGGYTYTINTTNNIVCRQ